MEQLVAKIIALIQERSKINTLLNITQALQIGIPSTNITLNTTDPHLGTAYTILSNDVKARLSTYQAWLDTQIKSTAQEIVDL